MSFGVFGPGSLYVTRTDVANSTPINIGFVQEFSYDESGETKQLYGQNQYALDARRATVKSTGKMKAARVSGIALNAVFHGSAFTTGQLLMAQAEAGSIPASSTYTITVANSAHFDTDLGVVYASTGLPFQKVVSSPSAGQYSVSAGVYTFASGDASTDVLITYAYTSSSGGQTKTVTNQPIGTTPKFQIDYSTVDGGKQYNLRFFQCIGAKLSSQFKLTDFMIPEIDFEFFANAAGQVYKASYPEIG